MYLVYDMDTLLIIRVSEYYGKDIHKLIQQRGVQVVNTTHPKTKAIVSEINSVNKTNF